jgi:hypothetical protein
MKAKNSTAGDNKSKKGSSMDIEELEHTNRKRKLQNKVLEKMVEHLNEQKEEITGKPKKK